MCAEKLAINAASALDSQHDRSGAPVQCQPARLPNAKFCRFLVERLPAGATKLSGSATGRAPTASSTSSRLPLSSRLSTTIKSIKSPKPSVTSKHLSPSPSSQPSFPLPFAPSRAPSLPLSLPLEPCLAFLPPSAPAPLPIRSVGRPLDAGEVSPVLFGLADSSASPPVLRAAMRAPAQLEPTAAPLPSPTLSHVEPTLPERDALPGNREAVASRHRPPRHPARRHTRSRLLRKLPCAPRPTRRPLPTKVPAVVGRSGLGLGVSCPSWRDADYFGPGAPPSAPSRPSRWPTTPAGRRPTRSARCRRRRRPAASSRRARAPCRSPSSARRAPAPTTTWPRPASSSAGTPRTFPSGHRAPAPSTATARARRRRRPPFCARARAWARPTRSACRSASATRTSSPPSDIRRPSRIPPSRPPGAKARRPRSWALPQQHMPRDLVESPPRARPTAGVRADPRYDMKRILLLMKSSCGKMEGQLAFRRFETTPWSLSYCSINDETGSLVYEPKSNEAVYRTLIPRHPRLHRSKPRGTSSLKCRTPTCVRRTRKMRVHLEAAQPGRIRVVVRRPALLAAHPAKGRAQNRMTQAAGARHGRRQAVDQPAPL